MPQETEFEQKLEQEKRCSRLLHQPDLTTGDRDFLRHHFGLAGLPTPEHEIWVEMETIGHSAWPIVVAVVVMFVLAIGYVVAVT